MVQREVQADPQGVMTDLSEFRVVAVKFGSGIGPDECKFIGKALTKNDILNTLKCALPKLISNAPLPGSFFLVSAAFHGIGLAQMPANTPRKPWR